MIRLTVKYLSFAVLALSLSACQRAKLSKVDASNKRARTQRNQAPRDVEPNENKRNTRRSPTPEIKPPNGSNPAVPVREGGSPAAPTVEVEQPKSEPTVTLSSRPGTSYSGYNPSVSTKLTDPLPQAPDIPSRVIDWSKPAPSVLKTCGAAENPCPEPQAPPALPPLPPPPVETPIFKIELPFQPKTKKLDILFVADTSDSLDDEIAQIAEEVEKYLSELPKGNQYNLAVMISHSPDSAMASIPFVIDHADRPVLSSEKHTLDDIKRSIKAKLLAVKKFREKTVYAYKDKEHKILDEEKSQTGQGELGMLALQNAISNDDKRREFQRDDMFFRKDAGLAVIFIADENDVCFDYAANPQYKPKYSPSGVSGGHPKNNEVKADYNEVLAFNKYCKGKVTTKSVLDAVRKLKKDQPVIITGIMYTKEENIPKKDDTYRLENEIGLGYLQLIELAKETGLAAGKEIEIGGKAVELGFRNFGKALTELGKHSYLRLSFPNKFNVDVDIKPVTPNFKNSAIIDPTTLQLHVVYDPPPKGKGQNRQRINPNHVQYVAPMIIVDDEAMFSMFRPGAVIEGTFQPR